MLADGEGDDDGETEAEGERDFDAEGEADPEGDAEAEADADSDAEAEAEAEGERLGEGDCEGERSVVAAAVKRCQVAEELVPMLIKTLAPSLFSFLKNAPCLNPESPVGKTFPSASEMYSVLVWGLGF